MDNLSTKMSNEYPTVASLLLFAACAGLPMKRPVSGLEDSDATTNNASSLAKSRECDDTGILPPPIPNSEIAKKHVPPSKARVHGLLAGRWDGYLYDDLNPETFEGVTRDPLRLVVAFTQDGAYEVHVERCNSWGQFEIYVTDREIELEWSQKDNCKGDGEYKYPSEIRRLDEEFLVLIDGMTGGVSAFRRLR